MRILANFSQRTNGNSYSVTFETMGDVPKDQADAVVDELFAKAKSAVERQINPEADLEFPPKEITIPKPRRNNGGNGKPRIKEPDSPISPKQRNLIIRLAKEKGEFIDNVAGLTKGEASNIIEQLMTVNV